MLKPLGAALRRGRGVVPIVLGATTGQGLVLASSPVLTRLYEPSDFGAMTVFTALAAILAAVSTFRLEAAIPLPREDTDAAAVAWAALCAVGCFSAVLAVVAGVFTGPVSRALSAEALHGLWWLLPITVLVIGVNLILSAWMVRERRYSALGVRNAAQGLGQVLTQTVTGMMGLRPLGLLMGLVAGRLAGCGGLASRHGLLRRPGVTRRQMAAMLHRYRRFPLMATWSALFNNVGLQGPLLVLGAVYGQVAVGLLGLTIRVLAMPVAVIGQAVAAHYLGEASSLVRAGTATLHHTLRRNAGRLLLIGIVPAGVLLLCGPQLFAAAFGPAWDRSGEFARVLAVGYLAQFVVSPVSQTLNVLERQGQQLRWDIARSVLTLGGVLACAATGVPMTVALLLLSGSHVVAYGSLYFYCARAAARYDAVCRSAPGTPVPCNG